MTRDEMFMLALVEAQAALWRANIDDVVDIMDPLADWLGIPCDDTARKPIAETYCRDWILDRVTDVADERIHAGVLVNELIEEAEKHRIKKGDT